MSLICAETHKDIEFGDPLMVAISDYGYSALSQEVLSKIPQDSKLPHPGSGVDIHVATSQRNFNGSYTCTVGFKKGGFLYSVSKDVARSFLPRYMAEFHPEQKKNNHNVEPIGSDW